MALKVIISILFLTAASLSVVAINPRWRQNLKKSFIGEDRKILAKAEGKLQAGGPSFKIFKIKTGEDISLEVYSNAAGESEFLLKQKIDLQERTDGYFTFQGNATNLALADIDSDGFSEIISATFDDQGVPRLNAFKYDPVLHTFHRMEAPPSL
jgi:hypothetical protein